MAAVDEPADLVDVERQLRDEDDVGAAGQAGVQRDPPRAAPHDLDHEVAVVALGGGVQAVDRLRGDVERRVEPEGDIGGAEIVVDGLGHADHVQALGEQPAGRPQRVLAADRDQPVEAMALKRLAYLIHAVGPLEDVGAAAAQDGAAPGQDAAGGLDRELLGHIVQRAAPAVAEPDQLIAELVHALAHRGADDRVQAGAIPSAREHPDSHGAKSYAAGRPRARPVG